MAIRDELLGLVDQIGACNPLPTVRRAYIPEPTIDNSKHAQFGLIELADGACGLFYAWMGESQRDLRRQLSSSALAGMGSLELAQCYRAQDDITRSVGLAAINAIAQSFWRRAGYALQAATSSLGGITLSHSDRLGMIGYFPSLARQAAELQVPVTVVERKRHLVRESRGLRITLDPSALNDCNKIICSAATLINDSVDEMLSYCRHAETTAMIGPSASFFPDPLFARGIDSVGGTQIIDVPTAFAHQVAEAGFGSSARRYSLERATYPGTLVLAGLAEDRPRRF